jgi:nuclear transcription factor Y gamma
MMNQIEASPQDYKLHQLPLARIKKVMKADPEVKMISAEAPILFAKGCDIFITELTIRAWIHAEESKRRTLQRSDIASALSKSDMFDFLIDIVPREEASGHPKRTQTQAPTGPQAGVSSGSSGASQLSGQHTGLGQPSNHAAASHAMTPDYSLASHGGISAEQDYRQNPNLYASQVPPTQSAAYGQTQPAMYGEMDPMYQYSMQPQQVSYR